MSNNKAKGFLAHAGLAADQNAIVDLADDFIRQMELGLSTDPSPSSLEMLPTYLGLDMDLEPFDPVIVMDAGGTNFRICLVHFDNEGDHHISEFKTCLMPGVEREVSKDEFYDFFAQALLPYLSSSRKIGFCFSFPCSITPEGDGLVLGFTKEVKCPEAIGSLVGHSIKERLVSLGASPDIHISILNDTVSTLLGGFAHSKLKGIPYDSYAGLVFGTGINMAYVEELENITKLPTDFKGPGPMLINTEAGNYNADNLTSVDKIIDQGSQFPGTYAFEKQTSGRYMGPQVYFTLKQAIEAGLFSEGFAQGFKKFETLEAVQLDQFLKSPTGKNPLAGLCRTFEDRENLYILIDNAYERAARYLAILFLAVHKKTGKGTSPVMPLAFTVEGSSFYKSKLIRPKMFYYTRWLEDNFGYYSELLQVADCNILGSAMAALVKND